MANINVGQLRSLVHTMPASQQVKIQAGTLKGLLDLVKTLQGSEAALPVSTVASPNAPVDLTSYGS